MFLRTQRHGHAAQNEQRPLCSLQKEILWHGCQVKILVAMHCHQSGFKKTELEMNKKIPAGIDFYTHEKDGRAGKRMAETLLNTNCILLWILLPFIGGIAAKARQIYVVCWIFCSRLFSLYIMQVRAFDTGFYMRRICRILEGVDFFCIIIEDFMDHFQLQFSTSVTRWLTQLRFLSIKAEGYPLSRPREAIWVWTLPLVGIAWSSGDMKKTWVLRGMAKTR